jgi:hypothetical protein
MGLGEGEILFDRSPRAPTRAHTRTCVGRSLVGGFLAFSTGPAIAHSRRISLLALLAARCRCYYYRKKLIDDSRSRRGRVRWSDARCSRERGTRPGRGGGGGGERRRSFITWPRVVGRAGGPVLRSTK